VRIVQVRLGKRGYDIQIGVGLLAKLAARCASLGLGKRCAVISDSKVAPLFAKSIQQSLSRSGFESLLVTVPAGERAKSLNHARYCYEQLASHRLERKSFIVALGGGVVGDLAGFVAATWLRGIPLVQVPTTLLAQVDSSVGGKVGVNLPAGKNLVGAFHQPALVVCDLATLNSLPQREFSAGLAEVIKYGIIYDESLFSLLERDLEKIQRRDSKAIAQVIARCCKIKAEVVRQDETETGLRAILNFGHTIGHAIEAISHYGRFLHGEAISIGQVAAARLSQRLLGLSPAHVSRIVSLFRRAKLPTRLKLTIPRTQKLLAAMKLDNKVSNGEIKFVLAERIGKVKFGCKVPESMLAEAIASLDSLN
jgi:3-dehydroquinate synthase